MALPSIASTSSCRERRKPCSSTSEVRAGPLNRDMAIDFDLGADLQALQARIRTFIADEVIPLESDPRRTPHGPTEELRRELTEKARVAGLLSPHVAPEYGGLALSHVGRAVAFEEAGYSPLGPLALNVFAPDEGNM